MAWKRAAGLVLAGGVWVAGCTHQATPKASAPITPVADEQTMAALEQSYHQTHPDALIGRVNAVLADRHIASISGLPLDQIHRGDVVTILVGGQESGGVAARVYDTASGYVQVDYGSIQAGQPDPRIGDLAVRFPGGVMVPPRPNESSGVTVTPATAPTTQPGTTPEAPTPTPPPPAPATTQETTTPPPPPTPAPATTPAPSSTETPAAPAPAPAPAPEKKAPSELNK